MIDLKITMISGKVWTVKKVRENNLQDFLQINMGNICMTFLNDGEDGTGKPFTLVTVNVESIEVE